MWGSISLEGLCQKVSPPYANWEEKSSDCAKLDFFKSRHSVENLDCSAGFVLGNPKACSDRIETTAIRSAVADLPLGHILRVQRVLVETWQGGSLMGKQQILMVKLVVKFQGPRKSAFPFFFETNEGTF